MNKKIVYFEGLNGIRSLATVSVLFCHIFYTDIGEDLLFNWPIAHYAVTLFFVLSGFLITYLLLSEKKIQDGDIDIKKFYFRRILRIWPIYFLYILISVIVIFIYNKPDDILQLPLLLFLFISGNFIAFIPSSSLHLITHLWSIGVEEQFYMIWPWVTKFVNRLFILSIIVFIVIYFLIKIYLYITLGSNSELYMFIKQTRFHCMLIGALGAYNYINKNKLFLNLFSKKTLQFFAWVAYFTIGLNITYIPVIIGHEIIAIISLIMIIGQIHNPLFSMENKLFAFLGKISYGIYVIHPIVLFIFSKHIYHLHFNPVIKWALFFIISFSITLLLAWISYTFFESKFLILKNKYAIVKSTTTSVQVADITNN